MTEAEARRLAAEEGLQLLPADNTCGFKGVSRSGSGSSRPFQALTRQDGKQHRLGCFSSTAEAALAVARFIGPEGCAAALAPPADAEPPMTEAEARRLAAAEGLQLVILDAVPVSKRARVS